MTLRARITHFLDGRQDSVGSSPTDVRLRIGRAARPGKVVRIEGLAPSKPMTPGDIAERVKAGRVAELTVEQSEP